MKDLKIAIGFEKAFDFVLILLWSIFCKDV